MQKRKSFLLTFVKVSEKIDEASKGLKSGVKWKREIAECVGCDWGIRKYPDGGRGSRGGECVLVEYIGLEPITF